jgi:hypothetical protein
MNKLYYQTNFSFSESAKQWIINRYQDQFNRKFFHDLDVTQYEFQNEWHNNIAGQELVSFLSKYNCDTSYYGISVFIGNMPYEIKSNPHMDVKFSQGNQYKIKTRFNVMVLGNPNDPMVWWDHIGYGDSRLVEYKFQSITGQEYSSMCIPGNDPVERWNYLGEPTNQCANLLTPSAFVKTDCAHAVILSAQPRLIVTVAIDKDLSEIIGTLD